MIFAAGQNIWSVFVKADADITPPSVPTGLAMTGRSATEIDLSWTASTDDVGVTGYHVYRNGTLVGTPAINSYADTGLAPNATYSYTVSAFDASSNESARSSPPFTASTLVDTSPPTVPGNLHQTGQSTSTITIAWNPSGDNVGVAGYYIFRNGNQIKTQVGTTFTDTGLNVYTSYQYAVEALDAANNASGLSSILFAATSQDTSPPSVPDNVHETGSTITSVSLAWTSSTDDVGVSGYHVYRDGLLVGSPGGTAFTDTGLAVNSSHTYTISAFDAANNTSSQSAPFSASSSTDTTPPTIPASVHTTSVQDNAIGLAWTASTDDVGVAGYKIYRNGSLVGTSTTTNFTDTGLTPVTNYTYTVVAYDAANNTSAASAPVATQTAFDTTAPTAPGNLHSPTQTDTTITLNWDVGTDNVAVSGYNVFRGNTLITSTTGTSFTDTGLSVDTAYDYHVQTYDTSGNVSPDSQTLNTRTLTDTIAPSAPGSLNSPSQTTTSISLSWTAATDDVGVVSYNVYQGSTLITNQSGTGYTDPSLIYNHAYSYHVTALDNAGNESPISNTVNVNTLPDTTAPTVSLTAPSQGQNLQLTFPISATASDDLALNRVEFYADGVLIQTITQAPFSFNWNSYAVHNGTRAITAKAIDASGNATSQGVTITISNPPPPLLADLNGDHKVNLFDLSILLAHWNKPGPGDFNNNGRVDIFDLSILLSHYGTDNSGYN